MGELNRRTTAAVERVVRRAADLRVAVSELPGGGRFVDCGVQAPGSLQAGLELARICLADLADVALAPGEMDGIVWPHVTVSTDRPVEACLGSQYAGWRIAVGKFFAMGSGPMRASAAVEEVIADLGLREESPEGCVGVLEGSRLPGDEVVGYVAEKAGCPARGVTLLTAPTASVAGTVQIVARSVETALHKLHELGFDVRRIVSGFGTAPLAPVAKDDLSGIGRTNDAILYGGRVVLWVTGDDESLAAVGPKVPSCASPAHGRPFLEIFEQAGRDFYKIDPHLFSPAEVVLQNVETGRVRHFGRMEPGVLRHSFGC